MAAVPPPHPSPDTFPSVPETLPHQKLLRIFGNNDGDIRPPSGGSGAAPAAFAIALGGRGGKAGSGFPQGLEVARGGPEYIYPRFSLSREINTRCIAAPSAGSCRWDTQGSPNGVGRNRRKLRGNFEWILTRGLFL